MAKKKKKQHGGKRRGAGRKPLNPEGTTVHVTASVPARLVAQLEAFAQQNKWSRSEAITRAIRDLLAAPKRKV